MPLEVPCPGCGTKLKAPDEMAGKKARCKKCNTKFRLSPPGAGPLPGKVDSVGGSQLLGATGTPAPPLPAGDSNDVPMATAVEEGAPAPAVEVRSAFGSAAKVPPVPPAPAEPPARKKPNPKPAATPPAALPPAATSPTALPLPTAPEPLPLDDDEEQPGGPITTGGTSTPGGSEGDGFAFNLGAPAPKDEPKSKRREEAESPRSQRRDPEEDEPRSRRKDRKDEEGRDPKKNREEGDEEPARPRYVRPGEQKTGRNPLILAGVLGLLAVGALVVAIATRNRPGPEPTKQEAKKEDPPAPPPDAPPVTPPVVPPDPKGGTTDPPKLDPKEPPKQDPKLPPGPAPEPAVRLELPKGVRSFQLRPVAAKPEVIEAPSPIPIAVDTPFEKIQRVFAPENRNAHDAIAVWVSNPGFNGKGQRLTVDSYSATVGNRIGRFEYDGDGAGAKCDVSADGKLFAAAGADGKVFVWDLVKKARTLDGFDPYTDKPDHKKAGLAAVFFARNPQHILTVTTAGVVHLHEISTRKTLAAFTPPGTLVPGRVAFGKGVAADDARSSLVLAVGGVVYQIQTAPGLEVVWKHDLKGEVGRSLAVGVAGNPGRVTYAFETDDGKGKKDRAVMFCLPKGTPEFVRWPDAAGEPRAVDWAGTDLGVISTARGAAWAEYDAESKKFVVLALADVPGGKAMHTTTERSHWYLIPSPTEPTKSLFLELGMPPGGLIDYRNAADAKQPLFTVRLDEKGLSR